MVDFQSGYAPLDGIIGEGESLSTVRNAALHADRDGLDHRYGVVSVVGDKDEATVW